MTLYYYFYITASNLITTGLIVALTILGVSFIASLVLYKEGEDETAVKIMPYLKTSAVLSAIFIMLSAFVPSRDDMKVLAAIYAAEKLTEIEGSKKIPENAIKAVNKLLEEVVK